MMNEFHWIYFIIFVEGSWSRRRRWMFDKKRCNSGWPSVTTFRAEIDCPLNFILTSPSSPDGQMYQAAARLLQTKSYPVHSPNGLHWLTIVTGKLFPKSLYRRIAHD